LGWTDAGSIVSSVFSINAENEILFGQKKSRATQKDDADKSS
jgi:hypothetical protein